MISAGATSSPGHGNPSRRSRGSVVSQYRLVSSGPSSTTNAQPWLKPADGAWRPSSRMCSSVPGGSGRSWKDRTIRRRRIASSRCTGGGSAQLGELLGHGPAEGDERVAAALVDGVEQRDDLGVEVLRLEALVVEGQREHAVTGGDEVAIVVAAVLDAEALGQPTTPRPLLARGDVAGTGDDVVERLERLEPAGVGEPAADQHVLVGEG